MMRAMSLVAVPAAPSGLTATKTGFGKNQAANLSWTDGSINETQFTVQRATSASGPWTTIATVVSTTGPGTGTAYTYVDAGLPLKTTLYYQVLATNEVGYTKTYAPPAAGYPTESADSPPSATVSVTTN